MLLWISIALLLDAGCALWFEPVLARHFTWLNVRWVALAEAILGIILALMHFDMLW